MRTEKLICTIFISEFTEYHRLKNAPMSILDNIANKLIKDKNLEILEIAPAPIMRKNNRYIYQLIIQSNNRKLLLLKSSQTKNMVDNKSYDLRWSLDIDPIDLFLGR